MKTPCVILDSVVCESATANAVILPRSIYAYWREISLERVRLSYPIARLHTRKRIRLYMEVDLMIEMLRASSAGCVQPAVPIAHNTVSA